MATIGLHTFPQPGHLNCPGCKKEIRLLDPAGSKYISCPQCANYFVTAGGTIVSGKIRLRKATHKPSVPIGTEGTIRGTAFKVIAYFEKKELASNYSWNEYLLYNYETGYTTLAEYDGHWTLIPDQPVDVTVEKKEKVIVYKNKAYAIFHKYTAALLAIQGETDWDVTAERPQVREYIAPPYMLIEETNKKNKTNIFYLAEYIEPEEIARSFGLDAQQLPPRYGIGACQPSWYMQQWKAVVRITCAALVGMLLILLAASIQKPETILLDQVFSIRSNPGGFGQYTYEPFKTPSFRLDQASSNLEFRLFSPVDNNWLDATIVLVNELSNQTWEVNKGIEYYHGYDGGESWSEGSKRAKIMISEIPEGSYHLNVYPDSGDPYIGQLSMLVTANSLLWRNFFISALILLCYPVFLWLMMRNYERSRWDNSNFLPPPNQWL